MLWKASLDFLNIVKGKNVDRDALTLEQKVELIIEEHARGDAQYHFADIEQRNT